MFRPKSHIRSLELCRQQIMTTKQMKLTLQFSCNENSVIVSLYSLRNHDGFEKERKKTTFWTPITICRDINSSYKESVLWFNKPISCQACFKNGEYIPHKRRLHASSQRLFARFALSITLIARSKQVLHSLNICRNTAVGRRPKHDGGCWPPLKAT